MAPKGRGGKGGRKAKSKQAGRRETNASVSASNPAASRAFPKPTNAPGSSAVSSPGVSAVSATGSATNSATGSSAVSATGSSAVSATGRRIFPTEVTFAILSRLPVKSLLRFKCVSIQWGTIVSHSDFRSEHLTRSPALLLIHTVVILEVMKRLHVIARYEPPNPEPTMARILDYPGSDVSHVTGVRNFLEIIGSTPNGIVCISQGREARTLTLWNPATRSARHIPHPGPLPDPDRFVCASVGLAFDPAREDFNVIIITCQGDEPNIAEVFSLRSGEWRLLQQTPAFWVYRNASVINGIPYWPCLMADQGSLTKRIFLLSFDVNTTSFAVEPLEWAARDKGFCLGEIKRGYLGAVVWRLVSENTNHQDIDVWERDNGVWTCVFRGRRLPVAGVVVGFYGDKSGIVVSEGYKGKLSMLSFESLEPEDYWSFECSAALQSRVVNYRESLYQIPEMGNKIV